MKSLPLELSIVDTATVFDIHHGLGSIWFKCDKRFTETLFDEMQKHEEDASKVFSRYI